MDSAQTEWFNELENTFPSYIKYGGLVPFDKSVEVLKNYFALLFPTYYEGEGFAGTLLDAMAAGVPVVASDWRYNSEIVNEKTGYVYPVHDNYAFIDTLNRSKKKKKVKKTSNKYTVTVMIVAHNEEDVIYNKLINVIDNDYPKDKIKYLIASDNSTDQTNSIVDKFIKEHSNLNIQLYTSKEHKGKTNAQNEAQKNVDTELLIMTDANSMFEKNAISELVSSFAEEDIKYVCGALKYINTNNVTADSESNYWNRELVSRLIESNIKTITAGNGAIYACRNDSYITIPPIECHDSSMPYYYGMHNQRALFNEKAVAYEKAGENT